jgi:membrane-associated HD superfamily phosphohydrolase
MNKSVGRQYVKEFSLAMVAYMVIVIVSVTLINISPSNAWWRVPLALTPIIPAIFVMIAYMRFVGRIDELQRRIQFEGLAFGFGAAGILTFSYGLLENVGFPHISWLFVFPLMIALWGIGLAFATRRYQ